MAVWTYPGFTLDEAIHGLMAYDGGCTDSGIRDETMKESLRKYLKNLNDTDPNALTELISAYIHDYHVSPEARKTGYSYEDAVVFLRWLEELTGLDFL